MEFGLRKCDLGLEAGIWASRLGFGPRDWNLGLGTGIQGGDVGEGGGEGGGEGAENHPYV